MALVVYRKGFQIVLFLTGLKRRKKGEHMGGGGHFKSCLPLNPLSFFLSLSLLLLSPIYWGFSSIFHCLRKPPLHPSNPLADHLIYFTYNLYQLTFRPWPLGKIERSSNRAVIVVDFSRPSILGRRPLWLFAYIVGHISLLIVHRLRLYYIASRLLPRP
jgi:hypothetical protein